jgi:putative transposase
MRTNRLRLVPGNGGERLLLVLGDRVSLQWNVANYRCRQAFLAGGKVAGYTALCAEFTAREAYRAL